MLVFLVGFAVVRATWDDVRQRITDLFVFGFDRIAHPVDLELAIYDLLLMATTTTIILTVPIVAGAGIIGGLTEFLQVGPLLALESLKPKLDKLNPVSGLKNLVSKKQLIELLKNLFKLTVTGWVVFGAVKGSMGMIVACVHGTPEQMLDVLGELVFRVAARVGLVLAMFGIFDIWWQRHSYMKDMMMTKDEVKKEYKESEGDPHHKAKRKEMHMEIMESAQMEAVKGADVIVTNPDHVAIALKYDKDNDGAPRVIAKGLDARAQQIKAFAKVADVPMMRNVPLAHALHRLEVGEEIPEDLYDAVAEVLNFVYALRQPKAA